MPSFPHLAVIVALSASAQAAERRDEPAISRWTLRELDGKPLATGSADAVQFVFGRDHRVGGSNGCNSFAGDAIRWSTDHTGSRGALRFDPKAPMLWTLMGCVDSPAYRDGSLFWQKMRRPRSWAASPGRLIITFADGSTARLVPEPRR